MKSIHIREISDETLSGLKRRAARHRRSLQKEIHVLLEEAARMQTSDKSETTHLNLRTVRTGRSDSWSREQIYGDSGR